MGFRVGLRERMVWRLYVVSYAMFWRELRRRVDEPVVPACAYFLGAWDGCGFAVSVGMVYVQDECLAVSNGVEYGVLVWS